MLGCCACLLASVVAVCLLASVVAVSLCPDSIHYEEFLDAFRTGAITRKLADKMMHAVESGKANIREIFEAMDTNGEGLLNREAFKAGLKELGLIKEVSTGELDELMAFVDADGKYACCACSWSCNSNYSSARLASQATTKLTWQSSSLCVAEITSSRLTPRASSRPPVRNEDMNYQARWRWQRWHRWHLQVRSFCWQLIAVSSFLAAGVAALACFSWAIVCRCRAGPSASGRAPPPPPPPPATAKTPSHKTSLSVRYDTGLSNA